MIRRYKVTGAMRLMNVRVFDPWFEQGLAIFDAEYDRCEEERMEREREAASKPRRE